MSVDFYSITAQAVADVVSPVWFGGHEVWVNGVSESNSNLVESEPPALYVDAVSVNEYIFRSGVQSVGIEFRIAHYARGENGDAAPFSEQISNMSDRVNSAEFVDLLDSAAAPSINVFGVNKVSVSREIDGNLLIALCTFDVICGEITP